MTLRSITNSVCLRQKDHEQYKALFCEVVGGVFGLLFPEGYAGCGEHEWKQLDSGFCVCRHCGYSHTCCQGQCPEIVVSDRGERVCSITGCVTLECEMRPERASFERMGPSSCHGIIHVPHSSSSHLRDHVHTVVVELLLSDKNQLCAHQEQARYEAKEQSYLGKALREWIQAHSNIRPNLLFILAQVCFNGKKNRTATTIHTADVLYHVVEQCTESITRLILLHGGPRVTRQLQNHTRGREFICSMLYLMRMGITYQNRRVLPKLELLNTLLPLQTLLPNIFKIRAKSITEGENIIKLDIRKIPL